MFGRKKEKTTFDNLSVYTAFHHVNGLPIAENMLCEVFSYPNKLEFKTGTTSINLSKDKITDMCIKTDTEIEKQTVSSVGGAISGAALFGPVGAIIGGRAKTKDIKTVTSYLIITYNDNGNLKYIGFDIKNNPPSATKLINEFKKNCSTTSISIEL